ncbi:hypothetical protein Glove_308g39 [Diversispora epigaea]|uniref:RING-type domain-containing protein n=1 Tax=Diversispora epigaea TaxID=1348612 RepID=A0A397HXQ2_9GLOM|nr:hypothetical protein Glove_308g39 [Diversispora epigaea]
MSEHGIHEPYAGYDALVTYLRSQTNKSYKGFLDLNRNVIIGLLPSNPIWIDLDNAWSSRFLDEAKMLDQGTFAELKKKVNLERNENRLQFFWEGVIRDYKKISVKIKLKEFAYKIIFLESPECIPEEFNPQNLYLCGICQNEILPQLIKAITILPCGHLFHRDCIERDQKFSNPYCPLCPKEQGIENYDYNHYHNDSVNDNGFGDGSDNGTGDSDNGAGNGTSSGSSNGAGSSGTVENNDNSSDNDARNGTVENNDNSSDNDAGNGTGNGLGNGAGNGTDSGFGVDTDPHPPRRPRHPRHRSYVRDSSYHPRRVPIHNPYYNHDHVNDAPVVNNHHENDDNNHTMMDSGNLDILEPDNHCEDINNEGYEDINNEGFEDINNEGYEDINNEGESSLQSRGIKRFPETSEGLYLLLNVYTYQYIIRLLPGCPRKFQKMS